MTICFISFKVLIGNDDKNSEVKHVVYEVLTRYLRFRPHTHQGGVCMRTEVFGVKQKPSEFEIYCFIMAMISHFNGHSKILS